jgi:CheY-like chemotaxis protein
MAGENGYQLISRLREMGRTMPAAAITALSRSEDRVRALASGFQAHLAKPVEPAELVSTVAKLAASFQAAVTAPSRRESGRR